MPTPRLERNLTASFASVDYRRKHGAGVMHTLGRDLPFASCGTRAVASAVTAGTSLALFCQAGRECRWLALEAIRRDLQAAWRSLPWLRRHRPQRWRR